MNRWYHLWRRLKSGTSSGPFSRFSRHWITWNECSGIKKLRSGEWTKSDSRTIELLYRRSFLAISPSWMVQVEACDPAVLSAEDSVLGFPESTDPNSSLKTHDRRLRKAAS